MSPIIRLVFLVTIWLAWMLPFFLARRKKGPKAVQVDARARWGIMLAAGGFMVMYTHGPKTWASDVAAWRLAIGSVFAIIGITTAWAAVRHLGRQWRLDAGLNADHELIRTGPYRIIRHPIYGSMLAMLLAAGMAVGTLPGWPIGIVLFIVGTEIRVRVEDSLLRGRFGAEFESWKRAVPAYIPMVR